MPAYTKAEAQTELVTWKAALAAVATGQSYSVAGRTLTRANLPFIRDQIEYFGRILDQADRATRPTYNLVPLDT